MFEIDQQNLPFVLTRQALLVLDLQNDFVSPGGILQVEHPPEFLDNILNLFPHFRASGNIIHVRSVFQASRAINEPEGESETIITQKQLSLKQQKHHRSRRRPSPKDLEYRLAQLEGRALGDGSPSTVAEDEVDDEAFLTLKPGQRPRIVSPESPGTNFFDKIVRGMDGNKDLVFQKTYYSAFKDGSLVQTLRSRFVTELYICGALTNISVFATALDAARHGYAITILEDCLGYRSREKHLEALKQIEEFTGCDIISSEELIEDLTQKAKMTRGPSDKAHPRETPRQTNTGLENLMTHMHINSDRAPASMAGTNSTGSAVNAVALQEASRNNPSESSNELPHTQSTKGKERVKTKAKTRRRPAKLGPKDMPNAGEQRASSPQQVSTPAIQNHSFSKTGMEGKVPTSVIEHKSKAPPASTTTSQSSNAIMLETTETELSQGIEAPALEAGASGSFTIESPVDSELVPICAGDTTIITNLLHDELEKDIFERIRDEVKWQQMGHQGGFVPRLVAVQGEIGKDGSIPIYRHPADESPPLLIFSPTVSLVRAEVEKKLGHPVNHVLIQFYRDGTDYISEHSDKTLDIVPNTYIANVSLGAQRTMTFRTKKALKDIDGARPDSNEPRQTCRAPLPHNSLCKMGLVTNMLWLHGIRQDKRMLSEKTSEELAYNGGRISLTFRNIGTFLSKDQQRIWGQGAISKTKEGARTVINGNTDEAEKMIRAFGQENHSSDFDWQAHYGVGFDVLHMSNARKLFLSGDAVQDLRVKLMLTEYGLSDWEEGQVSPSFSWKNGNPAMDSLPVPENLPVKLVDNDLSRSTTVGDLAILLYIASVYRPISKTPIPQAELARRYTRFQASDELLKLWRTVPFNLKPFRKELEAWNAMAEESIFIAGDGISIADFAIWPILDEIRNDFRNRNGLQPLVDYYWRMRRRESWVKVLGVPDEGEIKSSEDG